MRWLTNLFVGVNKMVPDHIADAGKMVIADAPEPTAERMALNAALSDLRDAHSEIKHVKAVARGFEDRALRAEAKLRDIELMHTGQMLSKWSTETPKTMYNRRRA